MKKAITILAVLIVLVGVVFAETHTIKIKADVDAIPPQFQLVFEEGSRNTNPTPKAFGEDNYSIGDTANDKIDAGFKLDAGGTATFKAVIANNAKIVQGYTLTFSDGQFKNVKRVDNQGVQSSGTKDAAITVSAGTPTTGIQTITKANEQDKFVTANFNGTKMTAITQQATTYVLATAQYTYSPDSTISPGTYYADVTLTIATTN